MTFTSYQFILIFLPVFLFLFYYTKAKNKPFLTKTVLLIASLIFYYAAGFKELLAMLLIISLNYIIGEKLFPKLKDNYSGQKLLLFAGVFLNLLFLCYCKYLGYIGRLISGHLNVDFNLKALILPLGISYITFSQIAYLADACKENGLGYSYLDYLIFVLFFPKVTVGPIALSPQMIPAINNAILSPLSYDSLAKGLYSFILGLSKKLLLADTMGKIVDYGYAFIPQLSTPDVLLIIIAYTLQLYFDFSGYCDMAIGICTMCQIDLPDNFDSPYKALSISDFWRRWHLTLTDFFRKYVYIPLGGNRKGVFRTYVNNFIIFVLSGIWHGSESTFILWGCMHGIGIIFSKLLAPVTVKLPKLIRWLCTYSFVAIAFVYFRAPGIATANELLKQLFTGGVGPIDGNLVAACLPYEAKLFSWYILYHYPLYTVVSGYILLWGMTIILLLATVFLKNTRQKTESFIPNTKTLIISVILFTWSMLSLSEVAHFIYVNF